MRNIVFDIGWVLVHLNYAPLVAFLKEHGAACADMRDIVTRIGLEQHECGALHGDGLLENLGRLCNDPADPVGMRARWLDMFELQVPMVTLAQRLAERYRVYLLSNVGDMHWAHLSREFRLHRLGHGALPSFVAGVMKPHPGIYAQAERRFDLDPRETVFIDDLEANIAGATSRGWNGIRHTGHLDTLAALARLGVEP